MSASPRYNPAAQADVCLLLEGTYPYVRGGVSTWVKQLIEGMPELTFSIIFLGTREQEYEEPAYELPDNLVHIEMCFLLARTEETENSDSLAARIRNKVRNSADLAKRRIKKAQFARNSDLHTQLSENQNHLPANVAEGFAELLAGEDAITEDELHYSQASWETIREKYAQAPGDLDFNHYFWSVRGMHTPLFTLGEAARLAPPARLYHSVSTGYAGFLGAMLHSSKGVPYIITEHGIYTKERELDLAQVEWIPEELDPFKVGLNEEMGYLRSVWIQFFKSLGSMAYSAASEIYTLYDGNRRRQIADGCPPEKLTIIPNGVNIEAFKKVRRADDAPVPPVLGLIGRVVPIKDIKTFIRAMGVIKETIPDVEGWLIGPQDEDEDYFEECKLLVESLDLTDTVKFLGFQKPAEMFPQLGLNVLTSVSEGQPLTTLEGYAAGIPALTTDVGSCSELIYGVSEEDRALGASGEIVSISNPTQFAEAALQLLTDRNKWCAARDAAIKRVEAFYSDKDMIDRYRSIYVRHTGQQRDAADTSVRKAS